MIDAAAVIAGPTRDPRTNAPTLPAFSINTYPATTRAVACVAAQILSQSRSFDAKSGSMARRSEPGDAFIYFVFTAR
jgi:hypothetical protein